MDVGSVNVEALLVAWLGEQMPGVTVRVELGNDLAGELPVVQPTRVAGGDDGFRLDRAIVDVDVYAATRLQATALAAQVRGLLLTKLRGASLDTAVVGRVATITAPGWRPYENTALRRVGATYEIYLHPVA